MINEFWKRYGKNILCGMILAMLMILSSCNSSSDGSSGDNKLLKDYRKAVDSSDYIIHALGGEDDQLYQFS